MKKNIEWLKNEVNELPLRFLGFSVLKQREEFTVNKDDVLELINQLDEPEDLSQELPVIPKFVADYIDDRKEVGFPIYQAIRIVRENSRFEHSHLREWLWTNKGQEIFVRAWLDGYTVEEEQKYYVLNKELQPMLCKSAGMSKKIMESNTGFTINEKGLYKEQYVLTEQEIKDYDPRYWAFRKPVEELEE